MAPDLELKECDLVMKGGITSGIVYPPLISVLKDKYRFRSIGGTSAGAIAAAITAAAEYGRENNGYTILESITEELSKPDILLNLFKPAKKLKPLFVFLINFVAIMKQRIPLKLRLIFVVLSIIRSTSKSFFGGMLIGIGFAYIFAWLMSTSIHRWGFIIPGIFGIAGGIIAAIAHLLIKLFKHVPHNHLGICTGRRNDLKEDNTVLTDWLTDKIDKMSDRIVGTDMYIPLTFGDLRKKPFYVGKDHTIIKDKEDNISLRMVTTNLSQNQPYILPFTEDLFLFKKKEFIKFFPERIVNFMSKCHTKASDSYKLPDDYYFLPESDDLPVIVATRLSLSFPILLSAIPLYTIKPQKIISISKGTGTNEIKTDDLQKNWFSDGGICSNFPIHFFDAWLPSRPTFGINLVAVENNGVNIKKDENVSLNSQSFIQSKIDFTRMKHDNNPAVQLSAEDEDFQLTEYVSFTNGSSRTPDLFKFIWSIFSTAQNYRDNAQSVLPSYRERIVKIRLGENEGGLNLKMPDKTIENVMEKGQKAGELLIRKFNFDVHKWIRFRVLMKRIEEGLVHMNLVLNNDSFYKNILKKNNTGVYPYFPKDKGWIVKVDKRMGDIEKVINSWKQPDLFSEKPSPVPEPVLRVTPEL